MEGLIRKHTASCFTGYWTPCAFPVLLVAPFGKSSEKIVLHNVEDKEIQTQLESKYLM